MMQIILREKWNLLLFCIINIAFINRKMDFSKVSFFNISIKPWSETTVMPLISTAEPFSFSISLRKNIPR